MDVKPRIRAGLLFALIPLAFLIGFAVYAGNRYQVSRIALAAIALSAAAVPMTVMLFSINRR
ncbi:hypothetical protein [Lentzea albidocapillata]|uniref:Uncharacterized protein n=1 Tax=Lentzea albidocapillata TaxID=40571 RepID=A0A1W2FSI7_9PSEU|nr:hypothetical protein [Lentzea albidocapillata]SMD24692.1 hypothetical protein SAMN05660733_07801 [Lentzea albidocapillata]